MNLKDIFGRSETGALTYEQFIAFANEGNAKFADLSEGNYVARQKYTDDLAARDTRITALDETVKTRDNDLASLRTQLENAGNDADKLGELNAKFADLQKQYDKDTKAYQKQLHDQEYRHAVNDFANAQKFSSNAAKRDFVSAMMAKNLQMENDVILGATDFVSAYTKENADAFVVEAEPQVDTKPMPHFADTTNPAGGNSGDSGPAFEFNFTGVRPHQ